MELSELLSGEKLWGTYRLDYVNFPALERLTDENDFALFVLDGNQICNVNDFFDQIEGLLQPQAFAKDWNTLEETVRELYKIEAEGVIFLYTNFQHFLAQDKAQFDTAVDVFRYLTDEYPQRIQGRRGVDLTRFYVLLHGETMEEVPVEWL